MCSLPPRFHLRCLPYSSYSWSGSNLKPYSKVTPWQMRYFFLESVSSHQGCRGQWQLETIPPKSRLMNQWVYRVPYRSWGNSGSWKTINGNDLSIAGVSSLFSHLTTCWRHGAGKRLYTPGKKPRRKEEGVPVLSDKGVPMTPPSFQRIETSQILWESPANHNACSDFAMAIDMSCRSTVFPNANLDSKVELSKQK